MAYTLDKIASVIDNDTCKAVILCDETPETDTVTIDASDVTGLDGYVDLAAGSRIISPGADFIAFTEPAQDGTTAFKKKLSNGGGSSATTETLTGKLPNVFAEKYGTYDEFKGLQNEMYRGRAVVRLDLSAPDLGIDNIFAYMVTNDPVSINTIYANGASISQSGIQDAFDLAISCAQNETTHLAQGYRYADGVVVDMTPYAAYIDAIVTIVRF